MNFDKRALGKGLSALINETSSSVSNSVIHNNENNIGDIANIPLRSIRFNPHQPRKNINTQDIEELSQSVSEFGILQPIIVKKIDDSEYQIIAGERRFHAAKKAGLIEIPAIIKNVNDSTSFEIAMIENIQRQNLSPLEEAEGYKRLVDEYGHTQESLAHKIGKSRSFITNTIRLLRLPHEVKELLNEGKISAGHARTIVNSEHSLELAKKIIAQDLSVRETEALLKKITNNNILENTRNASNNNNTISSNVEDIQHGENIQQIEKMLYNVLRTNVKIKVKNNKYQVMIKCNTMEELDIVVARLGGDAEI